MDKIEKSIELIKKNQEKRLEENYFLGSVYGFWNPNGVIISEATGYRDLQKAKKIEKNTIFRIASMTKPILGVAFMQLCERKLCHLDAPISYWLPWYKNMQVAEKYADGKIYATVAAKREITPRMLLSHSSGIGCGGTGELQAGISENTKTLAEAVESYSESVLEFQPGENQAYSPLWGSDVVAHLIERLTDMPYEAYIQKYILNPLGMADTTYCPKDTQLERIMEFVERGEDEFKKGDILPKAGFVDFKEGQVSGGAGLFSSLEDYSRFAGMLLNYGTYEGNCILKKETVKEMIRPQLGKDIPGISEYFNWGLSMRVCEKQSQNQPLPDGSYGWSGAYGTHFWIDPKNNIAGIYMMNLANGGGFGEPASMEFERNTYFPMELSH